LFDIFRYNRIGFLDDSSEVIFQSFYKEREVPNFNQITSMLRVRKFLLNHIPKFIVLRDAETTISWLEWYYKLQISLFEKMNYDSSKSFQITIVISSDKSEINIIFRILTIGIKGYTQYRIGFRKINNEYFACLEC
jgi:hypothetical protein